MVIQWWHCKRSANNVPMYGQWFHRKFLVRVRPVSQWVSRLWCGRVGSVLGLLLIFFGYFFFLARMRISNTNCNELCGLWKTSIVVNYSRTNFILNINVMELWIGFRAKWATTRQPFFMNFTKWCAKARQCSFHQHSSSSTTHQNVTKSICK